MNKIHSILSFVFLCLLSCKGVPEPIINNNPEPIIDKKVISDLENPTSKKGRIKYFMLDDDNGVSSAWNNVIWKKLGRNDMEPFLMITDEAPSYKKRLPFYEVAERIINKQFPINFEKAMDRAIATSIR